MKNKQAVRELGDSLAADWKLAQGDSPRGNQGNFTGAESRCACELLN
jgi:hypothetical protein